MRKTRKNGNGPTPRNQHDKVLAKLKDDRLVRYEAGETLEEIADKDGITPETAASCIKDIEKRIDFAKLRELRILKYEGAITNELIRNQYRKDLKAAVKKAVKALVNSDDDKSKAEGIRLYLKVVSLEEKPVAPQTTVNVQQNNSNINEGASGPPMKMEERIAAIRKAQVEGHAKTIDVEPIPEEKEA
jgi:predicted transcriptional regulator